MAMLAFVFAAALTLGFSGAAQRRDLAAERLAEWHGVKEAP
jgi:hypothetical protein